MPTSGMAGARQQSRQETPMKFLLASLFAATAFATPALSQDLDFSKITCKEFISAPKDQDRHDPGMAGGVLHQGERSANHVRGKDKEGRQGAQ